MKSVKATEGTDATIHEDSNPSGPSSLGKRSRRKVSNGESYWKERHSKLGFGKIKWTVLLVILIVCCSYLYVHWRDWQQSSDHQGSLLDFLLTDLPVSLFSSSGADKTNQYAIAGERSYDRVADTLKAEVGQYLEKEVEPEGWQTWENGINTLIERVREQGDTDSVRRLSEKRTEEQNRITQLAQKKLDHYWALYLKTQNQDDLDEYEHWRLFLNDVKGGALIAAPYPILPDLHLLDTFVKLGDFDASKEGIKEYLLKKIDSVETYLLQSKAVGGATRQTLQQTVTMARKLIRENTYTVTVELTGGWNHAFDVYIWGIWFSTQGNGARDEDNDKVQEWSDRANRFTLSHSTKWAAGQPLRLSVYRNDYLMLKQRIGSFYYDDPLAIKHFCKRSNAHFTRDTVENRKMDFHSTDDFYAMEYRLSISCDGQEWGDEELALIQNVETYLISSEYWRKLLQQACERRMPQGLGDPRLGDEAGIGKACP